MRSTSFDPQTPRRISLPGLYSARGAFWVGAGARGAAILDRTGEKFCASLAASLFDPLVGID